MKIILDEKEVKQAVANFLSIKMVKSEWKRMKLSLRRRSTKTEDLGSIMVEVKEDK